MSDDNVVEPTPEEVDALRELLASVQVTSVTGALTSCTWTAAWGSNVRYLRYLEGSETSAEAECE